MPYGFFDDQNREYVITDPKTPVKWINYIGTLAFGGFVDHTGGALICKGDPALNRITKYIPQLPASDFKGETLYLRLHHSSFLPFRAGNGGIEGGRYTLFSPFFVPTLSPYDRYECHVGLGYTRIISEIHGLRTEVTIFVPRDGACELRDIRITNLTDQPVAVDAIPVLEYTHPDALKQFTNADWVPQTMQSKAVREPGGLKVLVQYPFMFRDLNINYFTSNQPASSFETDRARFLGDHEYGTWANPLGLHHEELSNWEAPRGDNIAALLHPLGVLQPGETRRLITQLGQEANLATARHSIEKYRQPEAVDQALADLSRFWNEYLAKMQVQTPDAGMNSMLNVHNPRQCYTTKTWSRYLSLYQLGLGGARGIGCRDSSQDVMAVLAAAPEEAKKLLRQLLAIQRPDGSAYHQFNPLSMIASEGDALEREDRPHYYSDDHLWIVLAVTAYLKETGDLAFLNEVIPYYAPPPPTPHASSTVVEHLHRAVAFTKQDVGIHGLPRLGFADWNDTVNLAAGAESLFTANLYGQALRELIALAQFRGDPLAAQAYLADYEEMKARVNQFAWDGEWYVRYFDADGTPLGSKANTFGQIYINSQSWAVISGFAPAERALAALASVQKKLNTPKGIKLSTPGFNGFDPQRGGVTTYPPGAKENGGIFLHTNPWVMIAETLVGHGEQAFEYYHQINPAANNDRIDEFECEPYVYPQNILGDEHPQFGLGRNSWLSGTASWAYQAGTQYILGLRSEYEGLRVDPCIPAKWDGFEARRVFRGATYQISIRNPHHHNQGVNSLVVDGIPVPGNLIPIFTDGLTHHIEAVLE